jgi:hypothetical protein
MSDMANGTKKDDELSKQQQFDAFMKLAEFRLARRRDRIALEWKITLGLWAALLAGGYLSIQTGQHFSWISTGIVLLLVWILHAWFGVRGNWVSSEFDALTALHFQEHAEQIVRPSSPSRPAERLIWEEFKQANSGLQFLKGGGSQTQIAGTALLAIGLFLILVFGPQQPPHH